MTRFPEIRTERLILRSPNADDAERVALFCADPDVARMTTQMPHPYSLEDAIAFLKRADARNPEREALFAIEHPQDGLIGMLGFYPSAGRQSEIGYWLGRPYWGQGFGTEAATAALRWAADDWRRRLVIAGHFADNPASGQVLCKAGFLYTGVVEPRHSVARGGPADTRMMVWLA